MGKKSRFIKTTVSRPGSEAVSTETQEDTVSKDAHEPEISAAMAEFDEALFSKFDAAVLGENETGALAAARGLFFSKAESEAKLSANNERHMAKERRLEADKGILLAELDKVVAVRDKFQELCRELQRQNKLISVKQNRRLVIFN